MTDDRTPDLETFLVRLTETLDDGPRPGASPLEPPPTPGAESGLARAARQLARAVLEDLERREEATCELVSRLAHEIRTPLGSMMMTAEMLRDRADTDRSRLLAERLGVAAGEVREILEDTVELVKDRAGRREVTPSMELDGEDLGDLAAEEGIELVGTADRLTAPAPELRLALRALSRGARAAGVERPRLRLETGDPPRMSLELPGVAVGWIQPFSKQAPRGVGLQLARARAVLRRIGGDLEVGPTVDGGDTRLELVLPRGS